MNGQKTKIYLRNSESFFTETLDYYSNNFEITDEKNADIIVINDFNKIKTDKIVACNSTGIDHIEAPNIISLRGEDLTNLTAVAELTLGMMIYTNRLFKKEEIKDKTVGIIGYGRIGRQLAQMLHNLGVKIEIFDIKFSTGKLDKLLEISDIISLHITADKENKDFINQEKFEKMKEGAIFLNSSRPWLVEMNSLKWALDKKLAGCWFDFKIPLYHKKLIKTNHLGGSTKESKKITEMIIAKKIKEL